MQGVTHPVVKDVVLVGAGHSHVTVLRMFGMKPIPGVRFTLITREVHTPYSGMLPGLIAGHYDLDDAHIDTGPLARFAGARLYQDEVVALDLAARRVVCRGRPPVPYDLLSFNIGSTPNTADVPGAGEHAIPVKPIDGFLSRFEALVARVLAAQGARAGRARRRRRRRRRASALGRAPVAAARSRAPGFDPGGLVVRAGVRRSRNPAELSGGVPRALSRDLRQRAASRSSPAHAVTRCRGRTSAARRPARRSRSTRSCGPPRPRRRAGWQRAGLPLDANGLSQGRR